MEVPLKVAIKRPCYPKIPLLGIYPEETITGKETCTPVFFAALFTIARAWKLDVHQQMNGQRRYGTHMHACIISHSVMSNSLAPHGLQPARILCPWAYPGKNTGVGCHFLLQGILPTQGSNPRLLQLLQQQVDCLTTEPLGSPMVHTYNGILLSHKKE